MTVAACWPVVSGALKAALLIVVIACSVSEPAGPDVPRIGDGAVDERRSCKQRLAGVTACVTLVLRSEEPPLSV